MWNELSYNIYIPRSAKERLKYENDEELKFDDYAQRIIDDQYIYDTENQSIDCANVQLYEF